MNIFFEKKKSTQVLCPLFTRLVVGLLLRCLRCTWGILAPFQTCGLQAFSRVPRLLFTSLVISLAVQKLVSLMWPYLVFAVAACAFGVRAMKSLPRSMSSTFFPSVFLLGVLWFQVLSSSLLRFNFCKRCKTGVQFYCLTLALPRSSHSARHKVPGRCDTVLL